MNVASIITKEYLTTAEAAKRLSVKAETVQRYCLNSEQGKTPAIDALRFGRSFMIHRDVLKRFRKERRPRGRPARKF